MSYSSLKRNEWLQHLRSLISVGDVFEVKQESLGGSLVPLCARMRRCSAGPEIASDELEVHADDGDKAAADEPFFYGLYTRTRAC